MKGFVFTAEALLALVAALGLLWFAPVAPSAPLRLQEYRLCQDAAEISAKAHAAELVAFWRNGVEPSFLDGLAREAGATGYEAKMAWREAGGCNGEKVTVRRIVYDAGQFEWLALSLCYPPR